MLNLLAQPTCDREKSLLNLLAQPLFVYGIHMMWRCTCLFNPKEKYLMLAIDPKMNSNLKTKRRIYSLST